MEFQISWFCKLQFSYSKTEEITAKSLCFSESIFEEAVYFLSILGQRFLPYTFWEFCEMATVFHYICILVIKTTYLRMKTSKPFFKKWQAVKGAPSGLRQFLAMESSLKMMKNVFYLILKACN